MAFGKTKPSHKTREISELSVVERSAQLWLNFDEVLERIAISRSSLWSAIGKGTFPAPYMWKGRPLWTQADVRDWINQCVNNTEQPKSNKNPITWAAIEDLLKSKSPSGFTNKQIAHCLNADDFDTAALTRIMAKAGALSVFQPMTNANGSPKFYTYAKGIERLSLDKSRGPYRHRGGVQRTQRSVGSMTAPLAAEKVVV